MDKVRISNCPWEEIHGFAVSSEYNRFIKYLERQIHNHEVEEIEIDPDYGSGTIYGGRWFKYLDTGEIWRLIAPDFPFKGLWEPVMVREE
jgi:hypothetical protein